jgi:hypothetical protein
MGIARLNLLIVKFWFSSWGGVSGQFLDIY